MQQRSTEAGLQDRRAPLYRNPQDRSGLTSRCGSCSSRIDALAYLLPKPHNPNADAKRDERYGKDKDPIDCGEAPQHEADGCGRDHD